MPMPYKNDPNYWLGELDRQEKRVPMAGQRLARPVPRASSGWDPLMNKAEGTRSPVRLAGFMEQRLAAPSAGQAGEGLRVTPGEGGSSPVSLADIRGQVREREAPRDLNYIDVIGGSGGTRRDYFEASGFGGRPVVRPSEERDPGYTDVIRGDELKRHFFKGPLAGQERRLEELEPMGYKLSPESPGGIKRVITGEDIEKSRAQTEYKLAQYDLMAKQYLSPFMTTTTDAEGAQIRVRSEEGSKLYDKYARMFLTDPKKAESLLKKEAGGVAAKAAETKRLEAMSPEELEQFIADEEAKANQETAASIAEAEEAGQESPSPFAFSLSGIAKKREQEEVARRKRLYGEEPEEGPLAAPRRRLIDWLNRPSARRAY